MRLASMSLTRIFIPVLAFGLVMTGVTFLTNEYVAPWANHQANNLIRRSVLGDTFPLIREQVFFRAPGNRFVYVGSVDDSRKTMHNVMVYEASGPLPRLTTAREARWEEKTWQLRGGVVREFDEEGFTRFETRFEEMELFVGVEATPFFAGQKTPDEMTARELRRYLDLFASGGVSARFAVEYHRKLSVPFASAIFALLAAPLGVRAAQGGRFLGVGLSIALIFVYYALMSIGRAVGGTGVLPPSLAAWLPNALFGAAGLVLWLHDDGRIQARLRIPQVVGTGAPL